MYYKVKPKDTLSLIAKKFSVPLELILAHNPTITNPSQIFVDQQILIPNIEDVPDTQITISTLSATDIITKAKSAISKGIHYKLGSGGKNPKLSLPTSDNLCDCSGFVCWVLGISRQTDIPYYAKFGGWIYTDSMVADVNNQSGIFERITVPEAGCIIAYGAGVKIGHVGNSIESRER